jgi:hypothetical protein
MKTITLLIGIAVAAPASAQSHVYGNADLGKPAASEMRLSPEEAVRVLRASHSIADLTDYRSAGHGPTIVVMGESTTPWDWPAAAFAPTRPLGGDFDSGVYAPIGFGYAPYYATSYSGRQRHSGHAPALHSRPEHIATQVPPPPPPSAAPRRHIVMSTQAAGRRR